MNNILHFLQDSPITDQIIENFNMIDTSHVFIVICGDPSDIKYIKSRHESVYFFNFEQEDINEFLLRYSFKAILIHGMFYPSIEVLSKVDTDVKIGWFVWGSDMYHLPKIRSKLYAKETKRFALKNDIKSVVLESVLKYDWIRKIVYRILPVKKDIISRQFSIIKRSSYFITYIKEDFDFFNKYYPNKLKFAQGYFNTIEQYLGGNKELRVSKGATNILIGNSNTFENNHLDVFNKMKSQHALFKDAFLFTPLSYGNNLNYREKVINKGNEVFGENFKPLLNFVERIDYIHLLQSCSCAIFFHFRQQAMGNIIALLYMGSRIYLSNKNPVYHYLIRIGIVVFDFDKEFTVYGNKMLDLNNAKINRLILEKQFSKENVINELRFLSETLRE